MVIKFVWCNDEPVFIFRTAKKIFFEKIWLATNDTNRVTRYNLLNFPKTHPNDDCIEQTYQYNLSSLND